MPTNIHKCTRILLLMSVFSPQARRRQEDNLAVVFMGLVGVFFVCHILRVTLNIHEMLIIEHAKKCFDVGPGFPLWSVILGKIR